MSKLTCGFKANDIVIYKVNKEDYVILKVESSLGKCKYMIMPKEDYDNWESEDLDTYNNEGILENVPEDLLSKEEK